MIGAEQLRRFGGLFELVPVALLFEPHRERTHRMGRHLAHDGRDHGRVDAARKQAPHRDVTDHLPLDRGAEKRRVLVDGLGFRDVAEPRARVPVAFQARARRIHVQRMAWRNLADALEQRLRGGQVAERQKDRQSLVIELARHGWILKQRLDLRSEEHTASVVVVVQWFDAEMIARQEQASVDAVPERQSKDSVQVRRDVVAPLLVPMDDRLGVAARPKGVTGVLELAP